MAVSWPGELVLVSERGRGGVVAETMHDGPQWRAAAGGERRVDVAQVVESQRA